MELQENLANLQIGNYQPHGETGITVMSKQQTMNILPNLILTGMGCRVERHASSSVIEIWMSTKPLAAVKLGFINTILG